MLWRFVCTKVWDWASLVLGRKRRRGEVLLKLLRTGELCLLVASAAGESGTHPEDFSARARKRRSLKTANSVESRILNNKRKCQLEETSLLGAPPRKKNPRLASPGCRGEHPSKTHPAPFPLAENTSRKSRNLSTIKASNSSLQPWRINKLLQQKHPLIGYREVSSSGGARREMELKE